MEVSSELTWLRQTKGNSHRDFWFLANLKLGVDLLATLSLILNLSLVLSRATESAAKLKTFMKVFLSLQVLIAIASLMPFLNNTAFATKRNDTIRDCSSGHSPALAACKLASSLFLSMSISKGQVLLTIIAVITSIVLDQNRAHSSLLSDFPRIVGYSAVLVDSRKKQLQEERKDREGIQQKAKNIIQIQRQSAAGTYKPPQFHQGNQGEKQQQQSQPQPSITREEQNLTVKTNQKNDSSSYLNRKHSNFSFDHSSSTLSTSLSSNSSTDQRQRSIISQHHTYIQFSNNQRFL